MTILNSLIIYQPHQDDYLSQVVEGEDANILGWHPHPQHAIKFNTIVEALLTAQRIADSKGYNLLICELRESDTKFMVVEIGEVAPKIDPHVN